MPGHARHYSHLFWSGSRGVSHLGIIKSFSVCRACRMRVVDLSSQLSRHAETRHGGQQHSRYETGA